MQCINKQTISHTSQGQANSLIYKPVARSFRGETIFARFQNACVTVVCANIISLFLHNLLHGISYSAACQPCGSTVNSFQTTNMLISKLSLQAREEREGKLSLLVINTTS